MWLICSLVLKVPKYVVGSIRSNSELCQVFYGKSFKIAKTFRNTACHVFIPLPCTSLKLCDQIPSLSQVLRNLKNQFCMNKSPMKAREGLCWRWISQKLFSILERGKSGSILLICKTHSYTHAFKWSILCKIASDKFSTSHMK